MIEVSAGNAGSGVQLSVGQCPCFRWTVQVQGAGGKIETQDILISTDALLQMRQTHTSNFQRLASRIFKVGAVDALIKGGHVGIGFNGVTFGEDADRGYSELLRTGFYALANLIQNDAFRLGLRAGYDFERVRTLAGTEAERQLITPAVAMQWDSGSFRSTVTAHVGLDATRGLDTRYMRTGVAASARTRLTAIEDFEIGLAAEVSGEYDAFRELLGLQAFNGIATVLMDVTWVPVREHF